MSVVWCEPSVAHTFLADRTERGFHPLSCPSLYSPLGTCVSPQCIVLHDLHLRHVNSNYVEQLTCADISVTVTQSQVKRW